MNNVISLADFRAKRRPLPPPTKRDIAEGVAKAFRKLLGPVGDVPLQSAIRLIAAQGARAIVKEVGRQGRAVGSLSRFQFFGVRDAGQFALVGRVNCVSSADERAFGAEMFLIDPASLAATGISSGDNITKNNTFTVLITLPMSDFYTL